MSGYSDIRSDGGMDPRAKYEKGRREPVVRVFTAQGYEYSFPVAFPAQIALLLDIRELLTLISVHLHSEQQHHD